MNPREKQCYFQEVDAAEKFQGYLYRQHTKDFLFTAAEWEEDAKADIKQNFAQDFSKCGPAVDNTAIICFIVFSSR